MIARLRANATQALSVPAGLCLVWFEATCQSRLCAQKPPLLSSPHGGGTVLLNRTAGDVADELESVLLGPCVLATGSDGVAGDCADMNSLTCGTYRLTLEHYGGGRLGGGAN